MDNDRVDDEDSGLFRALVGPVDRVHEANRVHARPTPPEALPLKTHEEHRRVLLESLAGAAGDDVETGEELVYLRPGYQRRLLRRLRRGHFSVGAELDLHGMNSEQARAAVAGFLRESAARGAGAVRIVHGKGLRSRDRRPVLKGKLDRWLRRRDEVVAFCSAPGTDGGTGAVYVLLAPRHGAGRRPGHRRRGAAERRS